MSQFLGDSDRDLLICWNFEMIWVLKSAEKSLVTYSLVNLILNVPKSGAHDCVIGFARTFV
jgi:hypothetical protein